MRTFLFPLLALAIGSVLALAAAETTLRTFAIAPSRGVSTVTQADFERLPGIFAPGQTLIDRRKPSLTHRVSIDSLGYRGDPFPRAKRPGEVRILFTGDSFAYGDFVDDDETLPARTEARLAERCELVRVINAGLGGTTIIDQVPLIHRGLAIDPDLVVLLFSENDVEDLARVPAWEGLARNREMKSRFPLSLVYPVLSNTAIWHFGLELRAVRRNRQAGDLHASLPMPHPDTAVLRLRAEYEEALLSLRDFLTANDLPLLFGIYPSHFSIHTAEVPDQISWIHGFARDAGIPTANLLEPLRDSGLPESSLYLLPDDGHPSALGYDIASVVVARGVLRALRSTAHCRAH